MVGDQLHKGRLRAYQYGLIRKNVTTFLIRTCQSSALFLIRPQRNSAFQRLQDLGTNLFLPKSCIPQPQKNHYPLSINGMIRLSTQ